MIYKISYTKSAYKVRASRNGGTSTNEWASRTYLHTYIPTNPNPSTGFGIRGGLREKTPIRNPNGNGAQGASVSHTCAKTMRPCVAPTEQSTGNFGSGTRDWASVGRNTRNWSWGHTTSPKTDHCAINLRISHARRTTSVLLRKAGRLL